MSQHDLNTGLVPHGPVSAALSARMSARGWCPWGLGLSFGQGSCLATGAVMDGPWGIRRSGCHAGTVPCVPGWLSWGWWHRGTRVTSARGQTPLCFTSAFTSVGVSGTTWERGHVELWQSGVT